MPKLSTFGRDQIAAASILALAFLSARNANAAEQKLADLSYAGHHVDHGVVIIDTSGTAKLRITFVSPAAARVQVAPIGEFVPNLSPAVDGTPTPETDTKLTDAGDMLLVQNAHLTLRIDKKHLRVDAYDASNTKPITLESPDDGTAWDTATGSIRQSRVLTQGEHLYGLGQDNANHGTLDRRGTKRDMWTGQQIKSGNVTAQYPVPFYLSTGTDGRGYGCFVDNSWRMQFDMGKTHGNLLTWTAPGGPIDYYLFAGPSFKQIINDYTKLTGRPSMLPLWAFGFWQSRCFYNSFPEIDQAATRLQHDGVPLDVMVVDSAWSNHEMDYKWSEKFLAGTPAAEWFKRFHDRGLHVIVSTKGPMLRTDTDIYPEARRLGIFASDGHVNEITAGYFGGHLFDVTAPNIYMWLKQELTPLTQQGTDGWWLDLNEPEGEPPQAVYHGGTSADTHNRYSLLNNKLYYDYSLDVQPDRRPVILGRAGTAGIQRYSGILWTGDINSDWPTFRAHIPEVQNSGMSGLPYWTNDSGGFLSGFLDNDRYGAHAALYERWFEFTCFAPIARAHKAGPSEPYEYGQEVEATAKKYLQLRYRLMPYIYELAHEAATSGLPIVRPLVLEYQNDPASATARNEFLFGSDLLVAPVIWANTFARDVYLPPGEWISFDKGFQASGGQTIGVAAPRDIIPLFVRDGAILPMAPAMTSTGQKPWDPITLEIWPHAESDGSLYQDDDATFAYTKGDLTTTKFHCVEQAGKSVSLDIKPSNDKFGPAKWIADFHLTSVPTGVKLDGENVASSGWSFDADKNLLTVNFAGNRKAHTLDIALDGSVHARPAAPKIEVTKPNEEASQGPAQTAQFLPPPRLPIRIEAANYDKGGEGLALHVIKPYDTDVYRKDGVPIANSTDTGGGYVISNLKKDEWLAYTIDSVDGGWFSVDARVRSGSGGSLSLLRNRTIPLTTIDVPASPNGQPMWKTAICQKPFYLPPGEQILTVKISQPGVDLGNFTFTKVPELGVAAEAENGVLTNVDGVKTDHPGYTGSGFVAGLSNKGSSVEMHLKAPTAGPFLVAFRYANGAEDATFELTVNGGSAKRVVMPSLENWSDYGEVAIPLTLTAGDNAIRISGTGEGAVNLDQIRLLAPAQ